MRTDHILLPLIKSLLIFCLLLLCVSCDNRTADQPEQIAVVVRDSLYTLTETAVLKSKTSSSLTASANWRMEYRIIYMADEGSMVSRGDTVVRFDPEKALSEMDEANARLEMARAKLEETRQKNALALEEKTTNLTLLDMQDEINQTKLANAEYESEVVRQQITLEMKKTRLRIEKARKDLEAQRMLTKNSENLIELEISQAQVQLTRARMMLAEMSLIAPRGGLIVHEKTRRSQDKLKVGDQVEPQQEVVSIPDLTQMTAVVKLNEVDRQFIRPGLPAEITVEAYPDTLFRGTVTSLSRIVNMVVETENVKTYDLYISITGGMNFRLKPGLTAKTVIYTHAVDSASWRIPGWCLFREKDGGRFVETGSGLHIPVRLLAVNDGFAFVSGSLREGLPLKANQNMPEY